MAATHFLPSPEQIPACPRCGDSDAVQRLICGMPSDLPPHHEWERLEFAVCGKDEHSPGADWWCPACYEAYGFEPAD